MSNIFNAKCKECGGDNEVDLTQKHGSTICEYCKAVVTLPHADSTPEVIDLLRQGDIYLYTCEFGKAYDIFKRVTNKSKNEPEAYFGMALARFKVQYLQDTVNNRYQPICYDISEELFANDKNYKKALELATDEQRRGYERRCAEIDAIRKEFYELKKSGEKCDCFICCKVSDEDTGGKTKDAYAAFKIHDHLEKQGFKVFYSEYDIRGRAGEDYESLILYSLCTAKCMIVICSNADYLTTDWVKNEYTRFLRMIEGEDKEKGSIAIAYYDSVIEHLPGIDRKIQGVNLTEPDAFTIIDEFVRKYVSPTKSANKYCTACGTENHIKAKFCSECGNNEFVETKEKYLEIKLRKQLEAEQEERDRKAREAEEQRKAEIEELRKEKEELERQKREAEERAARLEAEQKAKAQADKYCVYCRSANAGNATSCKNCGGDKLMTREELEKYDREQAEQEEREQALEKRLSEFDVLREKVKEQERLKREAEEKQDLPATMTESDLIRGLILNTLQNGDCHCYDLIKQINARCGLNQSIKQPMVYACIKRLENEGLVSSYWGQSESDGARRKFLSLTENGRKAEREWQAKARAVLAARRSNVKIDSADFEIKGRVLVKYKGEGGDVIIPSDVTSIGSYAFCGCSSLTSIIIPNSVTSIEGGAFRDCSSLTSIEIPNSITNIEEYAFSGCSKLKSIEIPNSVTYIGNGTFSGCSNLSKITVQSGNRQYHSKGNCIIETKSKTLVLGCDKSVIPHDGSVTSIGYVNGTSPVKIFRYYAFSGCSGLTSIKIPNSVTYIGNGTFSGCSNLSKITVQSGNRRYHSKGNCIIETAGKMLFLGCKNSVIPNDGSVTRIGRGAFSGCSSLTSIEVPNSVTSIGDGAFSSCSGLTSIDIPNSVTSIGSRAFYYCSSLTRIKYNGTKKQWEAISKGKEWNNGRNANCKVYCTDGEIRV